MSIDYGLVCVDCGEALHLGKSHVVNSRFHNSGSWGLSSIGNATKDFSEENQRLLVALQHFMLLHRQHELRVLPDNNSLVQDCMTWFGFDDVSECGLTDLLRQEIKPPNPGHDPDKEEPIDRSLFERLQSGVKRAIRKFDLE